MSATTTTYTRPAKAKTDNRETWLMKAAEYLWGRVIEAGGERPEKFRVSCGWPSKKALMTASSSSRTLGQAWHSEASDDKAREVFISPALAEECRVMDVLLHEMIHAALPAVDDKGKPVGHGPAFQAIMKKVGLAGKPTATVASDELLEELRVIAHELGRYPHEVLDVAPGTKNPGRMVKGQCPECETIFYGSRQAWENIPVCGSCAVPFVVVPSDEQAAHWGLQKAEDAETLVNVSTTVELKTSDGRFTLRSTKTGGREGTWTVTDHQAVEDGTELRSVVVVGEDGPETVDSLVTRYAERFAYRPTREDALAFIGAIRNGDLDWSDIAPEVEDEAEEWDEDDLDELLGPVGEWPEDDDHLAEDEDETPDYEDGHFEGDAEAEAIFEAEAAKRDASGSAKSKRIIEAGGEGAMD